MSRSVRTPTSLPPASMTKTESAVPVRTDEVEALAERGARRHHERIAPAEHLQPLIGKRRDAVGDVALGDLGHEREV